MKYHKCFLHVDMDAFFASVEQNDNPELKGKPVIIGGLPGELRSVVSTASYEARKFGVHSAMPVSQAFKLCPQGIYMHGNYKRYSQVSDQIMEILRKYSPDVKQLSIDEASVEITGTELLFGPPEELAKKIQKNILDDTGLTVSIGLASTAYLAKLSSEINKPNGFYQILPGDEENFMLKLPLEKVWGIGKKFIEKLHNAGFYTTEQIYKQPREKLCNLMGEANGDFLYNVVRGSYKELWTENSHSISAETTFPVDISTTYEAETKLMELAQSVLFRMKNENCCSKTVAVKLRYNDFSTYTMQYTSDDYVSTLEEFFNIAKDLFEKKYEKGRGIRLLGIKLDNVVSQENQKQEVLFDFGSKKKQAVENAIMKLAKKHPDVTIQKARLFTHPKDLLLLIFFILVLFSGNKNLYAETEGTVIESDGAGTINTPLQLIPLPQEDSKTILERKIKNHTIDFVASGWWQGDFYGQASIIKEKNSDFELSDISPVFKQQVDMSLWFFLDKQYYFNASFADEFNKNTVAAGFYGKDSNPLKEFKIANRGIIFPKIYSIHKFNRDIGGGDTQSPGIYTHFEDPEKQRWTGDIAIRYDMVQQHSSTFYGKNSVSSKIIDLKNYITGQFFVLPADSNLIENIKYIYVENSKGTYKDKYGRKFSKLSSDEYITVQSKNLIVISKDSGISVKNSKKPAIIVEFNKIPVPEEFGSYDNADSFLGEIQKYFPETINLEKFSYNFFTEINGKTAILIQESTGFSPFAVSKYYDCGISASLDVSLGSPSSAEKIPDYNAEETDDFNTLISSAFYNDTHKFAQIYPEKTFPSTQPLSPAERYPLADILPGIYLGYQESTDIALIVQTYNPVSNIEIGTNAEENSVRVYRNGILDSDAKYNKENGSISLSQSINDSDKIYITWSEESGTIEKGTIAAQASYLYRITPKLQADFSAAAYWPLNPYIKYAEQNESANGYATVETGLSYNSDNIQLSDAFAVTFENQNINGLYRIDGMENSVPSTYYLNKDSGFILKNNIIPQPDGIVLDVENQGTLNDDNSEGIKDPFITGYKIPLEWNFINPQKNNWAAINIKLSAGYLLSSGTEFRLAIKNERPDVNNFHLYLQLGIDASDEPVPENSEKITTWKLTDHTDKSIKSGFYTEKSGWQIIQINLSEENLSALQSYHDARLIVVSDFSSKGMISAGPYEIITQSIFTKGSRKLFISSEQMEDNTIPKKDTFNKDKNYIQKITWNNENSAIDNSETFITAGKYFPKTNLERYKKLEFFFKYDTFETNPVSQPVSFSDTAMIITLDSEATTLDSDGKPAVKIQLDGNAIKLMQLNKKLWHTFRVDLYEKKVEIDNIILPSENYILYVNRNISPTRLKIFFPTIDYNKGYNTSGSFQIDEFILRDTSPYFLLQNITDLNAEKSGPVLTAGKLPLLEDAHFKTRQTVSAVLESDNNLNNDIILSNSTEAGIVLAGINLHADLATSTKEYKGISSAGHEISTKKSILNFLSFSDIYIFNHAEKNLEKFSNIQIDLRKNKIPLLVTGEVKSSSSTRIFSSSFNSNALFSFSEKLKNLKIQIETSANQKSTPDSDLIDSIEEYNYFSGYKFATAETFNHGKSDANLRDVKATVSLETYFTKNDFSPKFSIENLEKYSSSANTKYNNIISIKTEFPFTIYKQNFSFSYIRKGSVQEITEKGGTYGNDFDRLFSDFYDHRFIFNSIPFYELFDKNLSESLDEQKSESKDFENLFFSGEYEINWKHQIFSDIRDLIIPSNFSFNIQRNLTISSDESDVYIMKASILNTPFNLLQKINKNWYKSDEHAISVIGTAKLSVNEPEKSIFTFSTYAQSGFYFNENDCIRSGIDYQIHTDGNWTSQLTINYKRDTNFSPLLSLSRLILKKYDYSQIHLSRTNGINVKLSLQEEKLSQFYEVNHKLTIDFSKYITLNTTAAINAEYDHQEIFKLNITGSIGGKIKF